MHFLPRYAIFLLFDDDFMESGLSKVRFLFMIGRFFMAKGKNHQPGGAAAVVEALVRPTVEGFGLRLWDVRFEKKARTGSCAF